MNCSPHLLQLACFISLRIRKPLTHLPTEQVIKVDNTYNTMHATQDQYQECSECLQKCRNRAKANCPGLETWIKVFRTCGMTWRHDRDGLWLLRSLTLFDASGKPIQSQYALLVPSCALTSESILFRGWSLVWWLSVRTARCWHVNLCALNRFQPGAHRSLSIWGREEIYISTFMCGCVCVRHVHLRLVPMRIKASKMENEWVGLKPLRKGQKHPCFYFHSSSTVPHAFKKKTCQHIPLVGWPWKLCPHLHGFWWIGGQVLTALATACYHLAYVSRFETAIGIATNQ